MYFGFLGGSALLHLLAAHPKVVAVLGIATTVAMLVTPLGPQNYFGSGQQMRRLDQQVGATQLVDDAVIADLRGGAQQRLTRPTEELAPTVRQVLHACGAGCAPLTPAIVLQDATLLESALLVAELERHATDTQPLSRDRIAQLMARR